MKIVALIPRTDSTATAFSSWIASGIGTSTAAATTRAATSKRSAQHTRPATFNGPVRPTDRIMVSSVASTGGVRYRQRDARIGTARGYLRRAANAGEVGANASPRMAGWLSSQ